MPRQHYTLVFLLLSISMALTVVFFQTWQAVVALIAALTVAGVSVFAEWCESEAIQTLQRQMGDAHKELCSLQAQIKSLNNAIGLKSLGNR
jgi:peptidoglycan hydrolase CwlO-like protein